MVRRFVAALVIGSAIVLAGCNTVRGAGEDMKSAADATENAMHP
jgi:predicted small secreted protein